MSSFLKTDLNFKHAFSTRLGGVSQNPFNSLNLGFEYGDSAHDVKKNWEIFSYESGISVKNLVWAKQVHGNNVVIVDKNNGSLAGEAKAVGQYDGLVTNDSDVTLCIFTADCIPVLLCDRSAGVIAALHCGWKPLTKDIIKIGIEKMLTLGASIKNIEVAIGPGIGQCCFETDKDVADAIDVVLSNESNECYRFDSAKNKYYIDLKLAVKIRLLQLSIRKDNISSIDLCTSCDNNTFFSYRADSGNTGRMASVISL